jgi:hypothetical protein
MKWVAVILMGILMTGCATSPVVTNRQLSTDQHEIMVKADYTEAGFLFHEHASKVCQEPIYELKKTNFKFGSGRTLNMVATIECQKDVFCIKYDVSKAEQDRDFYECRRDAEMLNRLEGKSDSTIFDRYIRFIFDIQNKERLFKECMKARGYKFIKIDKKKLDERLK